MGEQIYVGNGKERKFDNGGSIIKCRLNLTQLSKAAQEYGFTIDRGKNEGDRMITIEVCQRREKDDYNNTHYVKVDTWRPDGNFNRQSAKPEQYEGDDDEL